MIVEWCRSPGAAGEFFAHCSLQTSSTGENIDASRSFLSRCLCRRDSEWCPNHHRRRDLDHCFRGTGDFRPREKPITIFGFGDFQRQFGGLGIDYPMSYAVADFFRNGGGQALVVRIFKPKGDSSGRGLYPLAARA